MTAMLDLFEKSRIISSAIFFAFPYGLIGACIFKLVLSAGGMELQTAQNRLINLSS